MICVSRSAYLCFLCQKRLCDCLPDTTGSTRYQRHLTSQIHCNGMRAYQFSASINDEVNEAFWVSVEEALVFSLLLSLSLPSPISLSHCRMDSNFRLLSFALSLYAKEIWIDILWWSAAKMPLGQNPAWYPLISDCWQQTLNIRSWSWHHGNLVSISAWSFVQ